MTNVKFDSVLVPVDFSDHSFTAVDQSLEMVNEPAGVFVVHVLPELAVTEPGVVWETVDPNSRKAHALEALRNRLSDPRYEGIHVDVLIGDPGHCIAEHAKHVDADVVVMPSHGRRGLKRLLLGSVAERVLRLAECNVLVLKNLTV